MTPPDFVGLFGALDRVDAENAQNLITPRVAARLWRVGTLILMDSEHQPDFTPEAIDALRALVADLAVGDDPVPLSCDESSALNLLTRLAEEIARNHEHPWHSEVDEFVENVPMMPADQLTDSGRHLSDVRDI